MVFTANIDGWDEFVTAVNSNDGVTMDQLIQIARSTNVKVSEAYEYIIGHITTHEEYIKNVLASSITELKAIDPLNHPRVRLLGREVPDDDGMGDFYWDPSCTLPSDDALVVSGDGISIGRWRRVYGNTIDPKWYTNFKTCVESLGDTVCTVETNHMIDLDNETVIVPDNIHLKCNKGTLFSNGTLTINGTFEAGLYQVFDAVIVFFINQQLISKIQWFGLSEDGSDESDIVICWLNSSHNLEAKNLTFSVAQTISKTITEDFFIDFTGSKILNLTESCTFNINCDVSNIKVVIKGYENNGNDLAYCGFSISGTGTLNKLTLNDFFIHNIKELSEGVSAIGIHVDIESKYTEIFNNSIDSINRTSSNAGIINSCGIKVTNIIGDTYIHHNSVKNIFIPDDSDGDGILVFSRDRLIGGVSHNFKVDISDNVIKNCPGRFIKSQCPNVSSNRNIFVSDAGVLITNFRAIDHQYGGSSIENKWFFESTVTGGASAVFQMIQLKDVLENNCDIQDNIIYLKQDLTYGIRLIASEDTEAVINFRGNKFISPDNTKRVGVLSQISFNDDVSNVNHITLTIQNNIYNQPISGGLIEFKDAAWATDSTYADKLALRIIDNEVLSATTINTRLIYSSGTVNPHLSDIVIRGNVGFVAHEPVLVCQSLDITNLNSGNDFYYYGTSGDLVNKPTSYLGTSVRVRSDAYSVTLERVKLKLCYFRQTSSWFFEEYGSFVYSNSTSLESSISDINVTNKIINKAVFNESTDSIVFASGIEATSPWVGFGGGVEHTPI